MRRSMQELLRRPLGPLKLEREQGFCDRAVTGGMLALMRLTAEELRACGSDLQLGKLDDLVACFEHYHDLSPDKREPVICRAEAFFQTLAANAAPSEDAAPPASTAKPSAPATDTPVRWDDPITELSGIGPSRAQALGGLGIETVGDLLRHYPARYEDRRRVVKLAELVHGQMAVVRVEVAGKGRVHRRGRRGTSRLPVTDGTAQAELVWYNQPYRVQNHAPGDGLLAVGTARVDGGKITVSVSECESAANGDGPHAGRIVPVYPLTDGVSQRMLRGLAAQALRRCPGVPPDPIPEALRARRALIDQREAIEAIHFPTGDAAQQQARRRIAYQELFMLQIGLALRRLLVKSPVAGRALNGPGAIDRLVQALPFEPTGAQTRVMDEIAADLADDPPAHRLIHGDVGSGKTVVAAAAVMIAARSGAQAALMAPTELLAEQHFETLNGLLGPLGLRLGLLTGSLPAAERSAMREALAAGEIDCAIGTHALFSEGVDFRDLALVLIDEQHRFGVRQRARLADKGKRPNLLVMSATPIPRTLALTAYGDFDVSTIDELPPGRKRPDTQLLPGGERGHAWEFVAEQLAEGRQAYVVCPAIEESDELNIAAAEATFDELAHGPLRDWRVGLIHGRMDTAGRRDVMACFRDGEIDVLVATSLIEVGVDVPNASVMVIESAERFGLAQLHQLRGRVSRSGHQPYCLLVPGPCGPDAFDRLAVLARTHDGFEIAEEDLRRRGPGELEGAAQSGFDALRLGGMLADTVTLAAAREDAFELIDADPQLAADDNQELAAWARRLHQQKLWTL